MFRPDPHLAIDRFAALRRQIAAHEAEAEAACYAILTLPDGPHAGFTARIGIVRTASGRRCIRLLPAGPPPPATEDAPHPIQAGTTASLPEQMG
jgi:hypothetical protein